MPPEIFAKAGGKTQNAPVATHGSWRITMPLFWYASPVWRQYVEPDAYCSLHGQTGGLWASGALCNSSVACSVLPERAAAGQTITTRHGHSCPSWDGDRPHDQAMPHRNSLTSPGSRRRAAQRLSPEATVPSTKREELSIARYQGNTWLVTGSQETQRLIASRIRMPTQKQRTASANGQACVIRRRKLPAILK